MNRILFLVGIGTGTADGHHVLPHGVLGRWVVGVWH